MLPSSIIQSSSEWALSWSGGRWINTWGQFIRDDPPASMFLGAGRKQTLFLRLTFHCALNWFLHSDLVLANPNIFYFSKRQRDRCCFRINASFAKECVEMLRGLLGALVSIWCIIYCVFCSKTPSTLLFLIINLVLMMWKWLCESMKTHSQWHF